MEIPQLHQALETCFRWKSFYGLSFWGENGFPVGAICERCPKLVHRMIRVSTVGAIRSLGLEIYRSTPWPHLTLRFDEYPTDDLLERLIGVFDEAVPNLFPGG
jgi:hypothetical protein